MNDALTYLTCACGWRTPRSDLATAEKAMRGHRIKCAAVTDLWRP